MFDEGNSPFDNYETTEYKMPGDSEVRSGGGGTHDPTQNDGITTPVWKVVVGLIWGIIFIVIAVSNNGRAGNPDNQGSSLLASVVGVAGMILIPTGGNIIKGWKSQRASDKAVRGFRNAVREQRLKEIKEFIENNNGTELGEHIKIKFDQIDKTNIQQLNSVWSETPEGKIEYEEWDEFGRTHR